MSESIFVVPENELVFAIIAIKEESSDGDFYYECDTFRVTSHVIELVERDVTSRPITPYNGIEVRAMVIPEKGICYNHWGLNDKASFVSAHSEYKSIKEFITDKFPTVVEFI